jgi:hypothetical protein
MSDDTFDFTELAPASGYLLPANPTTVLDIDWGLLAETLEGAPAESSAEPDSPRLAD